MLQVPMGLFPQDNNPLIPRLWISLVPTSSSIELQLWRVIIKSSTVTRVLLINWISLLITNVSPWWVLSFRERLPCRSRVALELDRTESDLLTSCESLTSDCYCGHRQGWRLQRFLDRSCEWRTKKRERELLLLFTISVLTSFLSAFSPPLF